jgi:hypothetical protein
MRKSWPFALAVIAVGGLAGVAIAGRPVPDDPFVLDPGITAPSPDTTPLTLLPTPTTSAPAAETTTTSTSPATATTTTIASTTSTAVPATTTTAVAPTTTQAVTTTIEGLLPRNQVRLVLANGDGRFRLASVTADRIAPLGYIIDLGDAVEPVGTTVIYYRPGFDDEAAIVALDISVPDALIAPLPPNTSPVTNSDGGGDVIVLLGPDAPR